MKRRLYGYPCALDLKADNRSEKNTATSKSPMMAMSLPLRMSVWLPDSVRRIIPMTTRASVEAKMLNFQSEGFVVNLLSPMTM